METRRLPIGISDYKKMIDEGYYYVDKTDFIVRCSTASVSGSGRISISIKVNTL